MSITVTTLFLVACALWAAGANGDTLEGIKATKNVTVTTEKALLAALSGSSTILIGASISLSGPLPPINKTVVIKADHALCRKVKGHQCTLNARNKYRHFVVGKGGHLTLEDLKLKSGYSDTNGGSILVDTGGELNASRVYFRFNNAQDPLFGGGAIEVAPGGSLRLKWCFFSRNAAGFGGAVDVAGNAFASINASSFHNNSASLAGGALSFIAGSQGFLYDNRLTSNTAALGGAVHVQSSNVTVCGLLKSYGNTATVHGNDMLSNQNAKVALCRVSMGYIYKLGGGTATASCRSCGVAAISSS